MAAADERAALWAAYWALQALPVLTPTLSRASDELSLQIDGFDDDESHPEPSRRAHLTVVVS